MCRSTPTRARTSSASSSTCSATSPASSWSSGTAPRVIWDGAPIHRGQPVKAFLARGGARRIQLEQLPGYAPDLNPQEGIWTYLKHVELGNVCCQNLPHLRRELRLATARLRHKRHVIEGCMRECGYQV